MPVKSNLTVSRILGLPTSVIHASCALVLSCRGLMPSMYINRVFMSFANSLTAPSVAEVKEITLIRVR